MGRFENLGFDALQCVKLLGSSHTALALHAIMSGCLNELLICFLEEILVVFRRFF
jgi:hypothetical protein